MMIQRHSRRPTTRRGMVAVQVAVCLSMLTAMLALLVDGGMLMAERRHAQAAADAAALAGAVDLFNNYSKYAGVDVPGTASASARAIALANYASDPSNVSVTVNIPPQNAATASYNNKAGYVEVSVTYNQARGFSAIFGSARFPVTGHAIARGQWTPNTYAVVSLDPKSSGAISAGGNGSLTATGGGILVDSNSASALSSGGNGSISATAIDVVGGYSAGGTISPTPRTGATPLEDPLKTLPAPSRPPPGTVIKVIGAGVTQYILTPGSYDGPGDPAIPSLGNGDILLLKQASANSVGGIYYLNNGLSQLHGSISMDGSTTGGVMLYNASTTAPLSFSGNMSGLTLSGLSGPSIYKGLVYFQARGATQNLAIHGNGSMTLLGTVYAPSAGLAFTGSGKTPSTFGSQLIVKNVSLSGNGTIVVNYVGGNVAPSRYVCLVE